MLISIRCKGPCKCYVTPGGGGDPALRSVTGWGGGGGGGGGGGVGISVT